MKHTLPLLLALALGLSLLPVRAEDAPPDKKPGAGQNGKPGNRPRPPGALAANAQGKPARPDGQGKPDGAGKPDGQGKGGCNKGDGKGGCTKGDGKKKGET